MQIDQIEKIAKLMQDYDLTEFDMESEDMKLTMCRGGEMMAPVHAPMMPAAAPAPQAAAPAAAAAEPEAPSAVTIDSPIVGTFYASPAPDAAPFVKAGDEVNEDTVVCIVEAMKVMNEIKAEQRGRIKKVLVDNATPVEYGQPLFEIEA